jgi:uncharacterized protein YdhG (YjbR/CyaY superfamily)
MAKASYTSVDEYLSTFPEDVQAVLQRVRGAIRAALPFADEGIGYQLAAYKVEGRPVIYFGGWKNHYSIYPATDTLVEAFGGELAHYEVENGTIRFPLSGAVPVKLIERIARFRAKEAAAEAEAKAARKKG